ncbi:TolC family protein [Pedobacter caeni]|uniref:Outer membrane protein TolC n=1 Tax=Pedobacter caeni TaxID=288992 RepID=A0A1M5JZP3_9SPHI|nr:TolC family protein [Pedobacter caeni]SHG45770.1 Outer membrane protein TolC [Pedobacter caeni]
MKLIVSVLLIVIWCNSVGAQTTASLSIEDCYNLARQHYPLLKQLDLIAKTEAYSIGNAAKGYLPQLNISGQASYQSAVTNIPIRIPGMELPQMNKDQYKLYGEVTQLLFDGGQIKQQKESLNANAKTEAQKLEVELYKLKERVNQVFFGILVLKEQLGQNELLKKDIRLGMNKASAAIANGTALKSSLDILQAELLKVNQRSTELKFALKGYTDMLALFINRELGEQTVFVRPEGIVNDRNILRPELQLYDLQRKNVDVQEKMIRAKNLPKFSLFLQGGLGRPALNMLSNDLDIFAIGGLRLSWSLAGFYTRKGERKLLDLSRKSLDLQKETFLLNTNLTIRQQDAELSKLQELVSTDQEIIQLRTRIKQTFYAQLSNGTINTNDYLREVNAEDQARQNKILHEVQLLLAQYNQKTTTGN